MSLSIVPFWSRFKYVAAAASLSMLLVPALSAQDTSKTKDQIKRSLSPLDPQSIDFEADFASYDDASQTFIALGNVILRREGYTLEAGEVRYNRASGVVEASGAVTLTTPDGSRIFSPRMELDDALKKGFIEDIRVLLAGGEQLRAQSGSYNAETGITTGKRAVFSPCKVCLTEEDNQPIWQIKAVKIVHNKEKRRVYYDDAVLEILGIPVLWTPKFSHPDLTVDKASGILPLDIQTTKDLGFYASVPYYYVIDDSKDITVTPTITTKEGLILAAEYRQAIKSGKFSVGGSITYTDRRDRRNNIIPGEELRGHVEAKAQFQHGKSWRSSIQVNYASDDTYLRRYEISDVDTLVSEYHLEGFFDRSYVSARTLVFQGLRVEDVAGATGFALPLLEAEFIPKFKPFGGTISIRGNALALHRTKRLDTQRLSLAASWQRRWISPKGFVIDADALIRSDFYNITDVDRPDEAAFSGSITGSETRNIARVTGTVTWPLVKFTDSGTHTIEPIIEVTVSPERRNAGQFVNEDSRAFELNDLNLFSSERASGFDLLEDGSRATYGLRWTYDGGDIQTSILLGQSVRFSGANVFLGTGVGLEGRSSNFVGRTVISYKGKIDIEHRYRLDETTLKFLRNEVDVIFGDDNANLRVGYFKLNRGLNFINREDREEIRASGSYKFAQFWKVFGTFSNRLSGAVQNGIQEENGTVGYSFGFAYQNDCIEIGVTLRENFTRDRDIVPGTSILFQLKLTSLG